MRIREQLAIVALVGTLGVMLGCAPSSDSLASLAPEEPIQASQHVFDVLASGSAADLLPMMDARVSHEEFEAALAPVLPLFARAEQREYRFAGWSWRYQNAESYHQLAYEVRLDDVYVVTHLVFAPQGDELALAGLHYRLFDHSLIDANAFTLDGKGGLHLLFLCGIVAMPLFVLGCMIACWRRRPRRRWLWLLFIPISFPVFVLDWSSGQLSLQPTAFNLFGAAWRQEGLLESIRVQLALPAGALIYLIARPSSAVVPSDDTIVAEPERPPPV